MFGEGSFGDRQLNWNEGLSFLNGWNAWLKSLALKVAVPLAATMTGAGALPLSQSTVGDHPTVVGSTPSHCSTLTSDPGVYPLPTIVNGCGLPAASPGTTNGLPVGCVIVPAHAIPAISTKATATTAINRRLAVPTSLDTELVSLRKPCSPSRAARAASCPAEIQPRGVAQRASARELFRKRWSVVHASHDKSVRTALPTRQRLRQGRRRPGSDA